ncbi:unnamed protein product [Linum trigynum]|uniref:Uncharacterized protein n=1 Tax=Linum trigynum TaxID=586398 RepID=A0AAV2ESQ7_9ROSI
MAAEELAESMIFTRGLLNDQLGLVLIDGGRDKNLIASRVVSKLGLQSQPHPAPYIFQSPYEIKSSIVVSQVVVEFLIGQYNDKILCDVVFNLPNSLVLGQPWFSKRQVRFSSRRRRKFRIQIRNKVFVVNPLSSEAVADDLNELHRLQEEYQQDLLSKSWSWEVYPAKTPIRAEELCSSTIEQSGEENESDKGMGGGLREYNPSERFVENPGVDSLQQSDSIQVETSTFIQGEHPCFPSAK